MQPCVMPDATRDEAYQQIFAPLETVRELREELRRAKKGKTGRLTTVEELEAMSDVQLEPMMKRNRKLGKIRKRKGEKAGHGVRYRFAAFLWRTPLFF